MTALTLIIKPTVRPLDRLSTTSALKQDSRPGADMLHAATGLALVVEAAVRTTNGLPAAASSLSVGDSGDGEGH